MSNITSCNTLVQHFPKQGAPINKPFARPPPTDCVTVEDNLKQLNNFILDLCGKTRLKPNLSPDQITGFKSLLSKRNTFSFSVSDKGGEFFVMNKHSQCELTEHYLQTTNGVYKYIEPTCKFQGEYRQIHNPNVVSLYTNSNINIQSCIDDIIALLDENKTHINLYGLKLIDIQEMLKCVLGDAFFTFNLRVFLQLVVLFMGCKVYIWTVLTYQHRTANTISTTHSK